jgi:hypothetical protein
MWPLRRPAARGRRIPASSPPLLAGGAAGNVHMLKGDRFEAGFGAEMTPLCVPDGGGRCSLDSGEARGIAEPFGAVEARGCSREEAQVVGQLGESVER